MFVRWSNDAVARLPNRPAEAEGGYDREGVFSRLHDRVSPSYGSVVADVERARRHVGYSGGLLGIGVDKAPHGGIVIRQVVDDSPAEEAGVEAGEVITSVDGEDLGASPVSATWSSA